jgi:hypothetical protein
MGLFLDSLLLFLEGFPLEFSSHMYTPLPLLLLSGDQLYPLVTECQMPPRDVSVQTWRMLTDLRLDLVIASLSL